MIQKEKGYLAIDDGVARAQFLDKLYKSFHLSQIEELHVYEDFLTCFKEAYGKSQITMLDSQLEIPESLVLEDDYVLALDIGGSTIRIAVLYVADGAINVEAQEEWVLSENEKHINQEFFIQVAFKAVELIKNITIVKESWNVGVSWSFPISKEYEILPMGKGFTIDEEVEGISLPKLIIDSFENYTCLKTCHVSVINDSIAVNLSILLNLGTNSKISLIIGTGINSCIQIDNRLVNTELGFFAKLNKPTRYDLLMDPRWSSYDQCHLEQTDKQKPFQPLEFLCSSRYLTELFRVIFLDLIKLRLIEVGEPPDYLDEPFSIHGSLLTLLEDVNNVDQVQKRLLNDFKLLLNPQSIIFLSEVVSIILQRAATFVSLGIQALDEFAKCSNSDITTENIKGTKEPITVEFIGSFLWNSQLYQSKIVKHSKDIIVLEHVENSSILGAGVAAYLKL